MAPTPVGTVVAPTKGRVLVVDDDGDFGELTVLALERRGFTARAARGAVEAVRYASEFDPHVALVDLHLEGGTDGYELGHALLAASVGPLQLVAVSGDAAAVRRRGACEAHFSTMCLKPVSISELATLISMLQDRARRSLGDARPSVSVGTGGELTAQDGATAPLPFEAAPGE